MQKYNNALLRFISQSVALAINPSASSNHMIARTIGALSSSRLLSTLNNVKGPFSTLETALASSIHSDKKVYGYFGVIIFNVRLTPRVLFLYWDAQKSCVANYMLHDGRDYYREFSKFIISTMNLIKKNGGVDELSCDKTKNLILIPKSMISDSSLDQLSLVYKFDFSTYQRRGSESVITKIRKQISSKIRPTNPGEIDYLEFKKAAKTVIQTYSCVEGARPANNQVRKTNTPLISKKKVLSSS